MFGLVSSSDLDRQQKDLRDTYEDKLASLDRLERKLRREWEAKTDAEEDRLKKANKAILLAKDEKITELTAENTAYKALKQTVTENITVKLQQEFTKADLKQQRELLDLERKLFEETKKQNRADMNEEYERIGALKDEAKAIRKAAQTELAVAESKNYDQGQAAGYAEGLKDGYNHDVAQTGEQRDGYIDVLKFNAMAGVVANRGPVTGEQANKAYEELAITLAQSFGDTMRDAVKSSK